MGEFLTLVLVLSLGGWIIKRHTENYRGTFVEFLGSLSGDFGREFRERYNYVTDEAKAKKESTEENS